MTVIRQCCLNGPRALLSRTEIKSKMTKSPYVDQVSLESRVPCFNLYCGGRISSGHPLHWSGNLQFLQSRKDSLGK